jgi:hypothetical protein
MEGFISIKEFQGYDRLIRNLLLEIRLSNLIHINSLRVFF